MKRTWVWLLAGILSLMLPDLAELRAEEASDFRAGAATSNITPALGGDIVGGFLPIPSKHIHDELHARCLVLDDGKTRLALVVCDVLGIHRSVSDEARRQIAQRASIPPQNVLISATHTHSATSAIGSDHFKYEQPGDEYQAFVARRIADGVVCAANNLRPAELAFVRVEAPEHVFNRRWFLRPGTMPASPFADSAAFPGDLVKMNPEPGSPNLLDPAGPTDPVVSALCIRGREGRPISLFAAYSLHYVGGVGNGHISADYFAVFCQEVARLLDAERLDPPFVAMLANGTSGDINNINFRQPRPAQEPYVQMRAVASDLARRARAAWDTAGYSAKITLDARYRELPIGCRRPDDEQIAWAKKVLAEHPPTPGKADLSAIYAERTLRMAEYPATMPMPLQTLRIGSVCIGTMPNEVFCEIGLEFKRRSPFADSFMVSLAHGYYGYLPTPRHRDLGGYETWMGTNRLQRQASEKMLAELLNMAGEMKKDSTTD